MFLKTLQISQESTCVGVSFLQSCKPSGLQHYKNRLIHRCFPLKFEKFWRTPILKNIWTTTASVYWLLHHILIFTILYSTGFTFLQITSSLLRNQNNRTNAVWGGFLWRSISLTKFLALKTIMKNFETVSWKRKKAASGYSQGKGTLNLNSNAYEKYEYEHLGCWYIKLTLFKRF